MFPSSKVTMALFVSFLKPYWPLNVLPFPRNIEVLTLLTLTLNIASIAFLISIESDFSDEILGDDAVFELARLYERQGNKDLAMEYYKKILIDFKGSIHLYQARKSYRKLRGDKI